MTLKFIKKVRKASGSFMIVIPTEVVEAGDIEEGDFLQVSIKKLTKDKDKTEIKKEETENNIKGLVEPIKKALIELYDRANNLNKVEIETYYKNKNLKEGTDVRVTFIPDIDDFWTGASDIYDIIDEQGTYEFEEYKRDLRLIGIALNEMGYNESKRTSKGNKRLISAASLGIKVKDINDDEPSFRLV